MYYVNVVIIIASYISIFLSYYLFVKIIDVCRGPVETADDDGLSAGTATGHGEFFLVRATVGRRIVELFAGPSVLVVELYGEIASSRDYVTGRPGQCVRRDRMNDDASLNDK